MKVAQAIIRLKYFNPDAEVFMLCQVNDAKMIKAVSDISNNGGNAIFEIRPQLLCKAENESVS